MALIEDILLQLTRCALWDISPELDTPLDSESWTELYFQARKQTVQGIVYDAVCRLPDDMLPPDHLLGKWMNEVLSIEGNYRLHVRSLAWVSGRLETESTLKPIVLKGLPLAALYPIPCHRVSGDIDLFYGSRSAVATADHQVESWGIPVSRGLQYESAYCVGEVTIEHHGLLVNSHVPWRKRRLTEWLEQRLSETDSTCPATIEDVPIRLLSPELDLLQLSSHALKHALNEGIGVRQLCDIALFVARHRDSLPKNRVKPLLQRFGMLRWTELCLSYCVTHLGLKADQLPYPIHINTSMVESMHREVLQSGNFGYLDNRYHPEGASSQKATVKRITHNVWRYFRVAPLESLCWSLGLVAVRTKEWFQSIGIGKKTNMP